MRRLVKRAKRKKNASDSGPTNSNPPKPSSHPAQSPPPTIPVSSKTNNLVPTSIQTANPTHDTNSISKIQQEPPKDGNSPRTSLSRKDYWRLAADKLRQEDPSVADQIAGVQQAATAAGDGDFARQLLDRTEQSKQALEAKRWNIPLGTQERLLRDQLDRLVKIVTQFKDVASAAASLDPVHAGLPLAGFCVLMQVATNDSDQYAAMVAGVEEIVTIVVRYQHIEALYSARRVTTLTETFEKQLINLYQHIIRYQIAATCYYQRNTMSRFLRSIPKLDDPSEVMAAIRKDDAACRAIGETFVSSDMQELHEKVDQVLKNLAKNGSAESSPVKGNVHWTVARSVNPYFTGRGEILTKLETIVRDALNDPSRQTPCRIVICGMGGQGKSEICLQLASKLRQLFWGVFWVDVSTTSLAEAGFLGIASTLKMSAQTWEEGRQGLAKSSQPWLLVLDNADDPDIDFQHYFPTGPSGVVVLTSRNEDCHQYAPRTSFDLQGLNDEEAQILLLSVTNVSQDRRKELENDAQAVASLLKSHPLALIQAGSYISRGHCTMAEYPRVYNQQRKPLLEFHPKQAKSRYGDVYATFEASAKILKASNTNAATDALQLLSVLSNFGPNRVPTIILEKAWRGAKTICPSRDGQVDDQDNDDNTITSLNLVRWHVSRLPTFVQVNTNQWNSFRLNEAIHLLKSFSLITTDMYNGSLGMSMHPLTHAWAKDRQSETEQHQSWLKAGILMALASLEDIRWYGYAWQVRPHLQAVTSWESCRMFATEVPKLIVGILLRCGWAMDHMRDNVAAFCLIDNLFVYLKLDQRTVEEGWLEIYLLRASNLKSIGKSKEAVSLLEQIVKIEERMLAEDHPDRLASQYELASVYHIDGQMEKALFLLEHVVKIREQTLPDDHSDRLTSQHELAVVYLDDGQTEKALSLMEHVVKIREQILLEDHPSRLVSQCQLANVYRKNGQIKKALSLLQHIVKIQEQTLAEDHSDRLTSQHQLAVVYQFNGQKEKALSLLQHVVKIEGQTLAEDHPSRLASQLQLSMVYRDDGQIKKALSLQKHVVKVQEQTLAEDHPDRLISECGLAMLYWDIGRRDVAHVLLKHNVETSRKVFDEHHPNRVLSEKSLKDLEDEMYESDSGLRSRCD